ncbi:MAG: polysaccharide biosynthesis C-terminal domain-containing protein [Flavobacteriales bacterium]|nr:polysaccharide biosynthesis C-terminal domain-containing protein [Flavobacteriales bacterium]
MQRKFILNLILLLVLNFLVKPFYIVGIDAEIIDRVGESVYGQYFTILSFTILFNIILDFGIINFNTRNIARHSQLVKKHFSGMFTLRLLLIVPYTVLCFFGAYLMDYDISGIAPWLIINQVIIAFILYFRSILSGLLFFAKDSFISVLDRILLIGTCSILLWGDVTEQEFQIEWFVYAQTVCYSISALFAFLFILPNVGALKIKLNIPFAKAILKKSFPFALLIVLMTFYNRSDSVMLGVLIDDEGVQAGKYAEGFRLFEALNMVVFMFASLLLPIFSRMLKEKKEVTHILTLAVKMLFSGGLIIGVTAFFYRAHILDFRYENTSLMADNAFGMLMISFFTISTSFLFSTLLTAAGKLKALNVTAAIGMTLNVGLNFILIPKYGAYGAAIASVVTQSLAGFAQVFIVQKQFKFKVNRVLLVKMVGLTLLAFSIGVLFQLNPLALELEWSSEFLIMIGTVTIACIATGLLNPFKMLAIIKERDTK